VSKSLKRSRGYLHYRIRDRELGFFSVVNIYAEATITGRISQRTHRNVVTIPCLGFVSNFDYEIFVISSVCVALFASEDEVGDEAILGGFNRGQIVTYKIRSGESIKDGRCRRYLDTMTRFS